MHRLLISNKYKVSSPEELFEQWTWDEVFDAHEILDAFDAYDEACQKAKGA